MRSRLLSPSLLALGALALAACDEQSTQPNPALDQPTAPPQPAVTSNTWLTRRDMPLELVHQAAAVVPNAQGQSILYAIGGYRADSRFVPKAEVRAYHVVNNTWTPKQDMPAARWAMNGAAVIGGKIYVTGGITSTHQASASVFVYDPASDTWTRKRDMPAPGHDGMTGVIANRLYVVTVSQTGMVPNFFRLNPARDSWASLSSPTNYPLVITGGGVINKKLYLTGNTLGGESRLLEYDPGTNQWTQKRSWSSQSCLPDSGFSCYLLGPTAVMLGHLYVIGHEEAYPSNPPGIFIYDPISDTWERKPLLTTFSYWADYELTAARVFVNGEPRIEVIGGYRPGNNQQYIP